MKLRQFVSGSAVLLAGWLGLTFVHEVPSQRYRSPGQPTQTVQKTGKPGSPDASQDSTLQVSLPR